MTALLMRNMNRVELLAPAGGYETMVGAFNAGADAVYLGGSKFGARAYADNFDTQQVLDAISYAHLHHKKIYMTVNTLVKEREFNQLYDFMLPYAQKGLDGVIVQDFGVMRFIRDEFPGVEVHASTQQTVTGVNGAKLLKELGCCRVVPARELSLQEMQDIREKADIEVEAFIHGAMCYCYSGMCLFSSMVGERSGNRGRCAQPCRLPYSYNGQDASYPLSLKDMCTVNIIPELIRAGLSSFKIEGRMKKPEYSAGVTAIYRKYIDKFYADPEGEFKVSKEDVKTLEGLYQRTGICDGYYHRHNGREMVTISSPAYNATSEEILTKVRDRFLGSTMKIKCDLFCKLIEGQEALLKMTVRRDGQTFEEEVTGNIVTKAMKRPMDEDSVKKQIEKLGNTPFEAGNVTVIIDDSVSGCGIFMPVSELNELRRALCEKMEERLSSGSVAGADGHEESDSKSDKDKGNAAESVNRDITVNKISGEREIKKVSPDFHVLVNTKKQLERVSSFAKDHEQTLRVYVDSTLFLSITDSERSAFGSNMDMFVALPYVTRTERFDGTRDIEAIARSIAERGYKGLLVRNLEQLGFLKELGFEGDVILDYSMYVWNKDAAGFLLEIGDDISFVKEISVPLELNIHEAKDVVKAIKKNYDIKVSYEVYGRVPMMISAGCVKKTMDKCSGRLHELHTEKYSMLDRMSNEIFVTTNCRNCYNVIWNAHPTMLYKKLGEIRDAGLFDHLRLDLSTEDGEGTGTVLSAFIDDDRQYAQVLCDGKYTLGHYKRGVE